MAEHIGLVHSNRLKRDKWEQKSLYFDCLSLNLIKEVLYDTSI